MSIKRDSLLFASTVKDSIATDDKQVVMVMMDIYQLSVQFDIPRLEQMCVQYLEHTISRGNVLEALFHSDNMQ